MYQFSKVRPFKWASSLRVSKLSWHTPLDLLLVSVVRTYLHYIFAVFFWAPTFKWMITISNIGDLDRPAHKISANQQIAIFGTGVVFCQYSLKVTPVNYNLFAANFFMFISAGYQIYRKRSVPEELGGFWGIKPVVKATMPKE